MTIRSHPRGLGAVACVALLAGCGSSTSGGSSPSPSGSGAPATHGSSAAPATTTASASPTSNSTAAGAPGVPEPARQHTRAGAIAFANYYTDKVNALGLKPRKGVLEPLSMEGCKSCQNYIETVNENVRDKTKFDNAQMTRVRTYSPYADSVRPSVWVVVHPTDVHLLNQSGDRIQSFKKLPPAAMVFHLKWTRNGWSTSEIKVDKSVQE